MSGFRPRIRPLVCRTRYRPSPTMNMLWGGGGGGGMDNSDKNKLVSSAKFSTRFEVKYFSKLKDYTSS